MNYLSTHAELAEFYRTMTFIFGLTIMGGSVVAIVQPTTQAATQAEQQASSLGRVSRGGSKWRYLQSKKS